METLATTMSCRVLRPAFLTYDGLLKRYSVLNKAMSLQQPCPIAVLLLLLFSYSDHWAAIGGRMMLQSTGAAQGSNAGNTGGGASGAAGGGVVGAGGAGGGADVGSTSIGGSTPYLQGAALAAALAQSGIPLAVLPAGNSSSFAEGVSTDKGERGAAASFHMTSHDARVHAHRCAPLQGGSCSGSDAEAAAAMQSAAKSLCCSC